MSETTHTPGPWEVSTLDGRTIGPVQYTHTDPVVRQFEIPQQQAVAVVKERIGVTEANARLIAASPELLAACEAVLRYDASILGRAARGEVDLLEGGGGTASGTDLDKLYFDMVDKARVAVAKAKATKAQ